MCIYLNMLIAKGTEPLFKWLKSPGIWPPGQSRVVKQSKPTSPEVAHRREGIGVFKCELTVEIVFSSWRSFVLIHSDHVYRSRPLVDQNFRIILTCTKGSHPFHLHYGWRGTCWVETEERGRYSDGAKLTDARRSWSKTSRLSAKSNELQNASKEMHQNNF